MNWWTSLLLYLLGCGCGPYGPGHTHSLTFRGCGPLEVDQPVPCSPGLLHSTARHTVQQVDHTRMPKLLHVQIHIEVFLKKTHKACIIIVKYSLPLLHHSLPLSPPSFFPPPSSPLPPPSSPVPLPSSPPPSFLLPPFLPPPSP